MIAKKPILVTGMPRSGTTWVGRIIEHTPSVRYIHEPFNISSQFCRCGVKFEHWFYFLWSENIHGFQNHLKHTIFPSFNRIGLLNFIDKARRTKRVGAVTEYVRCYFSSRPLVKDPIAVFSIEQLAASFNMDVIVLIRHPAAIASSYKTLNWTHPFSHFLCQPMLMNKHLDKYRSEIEDFTKNEYDNVDQAALLWKLIYSLIAKYQKTHPEWIFIRHEDLTLNPLKGFHDIFNRLNLPLSESTRRVVTAHHLQDQINIPKDPYAIKQNPNLVVSKWKNNLTNAEIHRIRELVDNVSSLFYTDEHWKI
jgi:hypothetical protein